MHHGQPVPGLDARAQAHHFGQANAVVDGVAGLAPAAAEFDHQQPDVARCHCMHPSATCRHHGAPHRRHGQVAGGTFDEIRRTAQGRDHARKTRERRAVGE